MNDDKTHKECIYLSDDGNNCNNKVLATRSTLNVIGQHVGH